MILNYLATRKVSIVQIQITRMKKTTKKEHTHLFELYKAKKTLEIQRCIHCGCLKKYHYKAK